MMREVYHGSNQPVLKPLVDKGRDNLDFGKAFYLTTNKKQAETWANVVAQRNGGTPTLNTYLLDDESIRKKKFKRLVFKKYSIKWLDFVVRCRKGENPWKEYALVEGGVANDKVIDTVEGYMNGDFSARTALGRLKYSKPNNQIAIINQEIINEHLTFKESTILSAE